MSTFVYRNLGVYFLNMQIIGNLKFSEADLEGAVICIFRKFTKNFAYPNGAECKIYQEHSYKYVLKVKSRRDLVYERYISLNKDII